MNNEVFLEPKKTSDDYILGSKVIHYANTNLPQLYLVKKEDFFHIIISVSALQPHRKIVLDSIVYFGVYSNKTIVSEAYIYADCFSKPLEQKLIIKAANETIETDVNEIINELKDE